MGGVRVRVRVRVRVMLELGSVRVGVRVPGGGMPPSRQCPPPWGVGLLASSSAHMEKKPERCSSIRAERSDGQPAEEVAMPMERMRALSSADASE